MSDRFALSGDPDSIEASARQWGTFASEASSASADIRSLESSEFIGDEAETFRSKVNQDLPPNLDRVDEAWTVVKNALNTYAGQLREHQRKLAALAQTHAEQQRQLENARTALSSAQRADRNEASRVREASARLQPGESLPPSTYVSSTSDARTTLTNAQTNLQQTINAANGIKTEHNTDLQACCREIDRAKGMRFAEPPGFFGRIGNAVVSWVQENADILRQISGVLKIISAIAGVLSLVPGLNVIMGPIALATGAAALIIDGLLVAAGEGSLTDLLIDAGTMLIPGAGRLIGAGLRSAVGAGRVAAISARGSQMFNASTAGAAVRAVRGSSAYRGALRLNDAIYSNVNRIPGMARLNTAAANRAINRVRATGTPVQTAQAIVNRNPGIIQQTRNNPLVTRPTPRVGTRAQVAALNQRTPADELICPRSGTAVPSNPARTVDPVTGRADPMGQTMPFTRPGHPNAMSMGHAPGHDYSASQVVHTHYGSTRAQVIDDYNNVGHYHGYESATANSGAAGASHLQNYVDNRSLVWDTTHPAHAAGGLIRLGNDKQ